MDKYKAKIEIAFLFRDLVDSPVKVQCLSEIVPLGICDNQKGDG